MLYVTWTGFWGCRKPHWEREARTGGSLPCVKHFGEAGVKGWDLAMTLSVSSPRANLWSRGQRQPDLSSGPVKLAAETSFWFVFNLKSSDLRNPDTCGFQCYFCFPGQCWPNYPCGQKHFGLFQLILCFPYQAAIYFAISVNAS